MKEPRWYWWAPSIYEAGTGRHVATVSDERDAQAIIAAHNAEVEQED